MNELHGAGVALVTPFASDGTVDYDGLQNLIEHQIAGGIDYLVSLGTTGETATLEQHEKQEIWRFTAEKVAGRVPLVAGIGGNHTTEIVAQVRSFDQAGYVAILSVSPYYNKPTQEGIFQHYQAVAAAAPLPVILYNVPSRTGSNMTAETTVRLARESENIIAVKEASANFDQFNKIMRDKPDHFLLISGDDPVTLPMMALGAVGVISVVANVFPRAVATLTRLCADGSLEEARRLHARLIRFTELCFIDGNPAGVKYALKQLGICADTLRLPLTPVREQTAAEIDAQLEQLRSHDFY